MHNTLLERKLAAAIRELDEALADLERERGRSFLIGRELADVRREMDGLQQSISDLSHPNCQMLLRERDEAREIAEQWRNRLCPKAAGNAHVALPWEEQQ